jgi:hypothetical protein
MVVLPKGTLVHFRGMPFRLLSDAETNGLQSNYDLVAGERQRVSYGVGQPGVTPAGHPEVAPLMSGQAEEFDARLDQGSTRDFHRLAARVGQSGRDNCSMNRAPTSAKDRLRLQRLTPVFARS